MSLFSANDNRYFSQTARSARDWYDSVCNSGRWFSEPFENPMYGLQLIEHLSYLERETYFDFLASFDLQVQTVRTPLDWSPNRDWSRPVQQSQRYTATVGSELPINLIRMPNFTAGRIHSDDEVVGRETDFHSGVTSILFSDDAMFEYDSSFPPSGCGVFGAILISPNRRYGGGFLGPRSTAGGEGILFERAKVRLAGTNHRQAFAFSWYHLTNLGYFGVGLPA